ncbi:peptidase family C54 [Dictyocaulus viviparus]|uniref:Cysteine protease n=1 Tax=Dictyocaulus viviparus TaxID=29172 RepID=A0A0D8XKA1_DICVI|nr:peptidase family C54 [Dictyocaulus viviparus]
MVETYLTFEPSFWELQDNGLFETTDQIFLLGNHFNVNEGLDPVKKYVTSRLWFTYRRNFAPIGGTGPETDQGWGCMLRCAQMLLGEVLLRRHIGRHFEWIEGVPPTGDYERVLRMFLDEKTALFSIHQIAQMGVSEGKSVGEWFGPNTAAQVIKKLAVFDSWSGIAVHVALDNILVSSDVHTIATLAPPKDAIKLIMDDNRNVDESYITLLNDSTVSDDRKCEWRPLLLLIPLRLGLTSINRCYLPAIEEYFKLESCVGIIGGRPNHALYFIGIAGDRGFVSPRQFQLLYLDPHYCRPSVYEKYGGLKLMMENSFDRLEEEDVPQSVPTKGLDKILDDSSFHCKMLLHMSYDQVDPSMALAFFCESAGAFEKLTNDLKKNVFTASQPSLFEQLDSRPKYWPPFEPYTGVKAKILMRDFDDMCAPNYVIDDGFEVLEETEDLLTDLAEEVPN